MLKRRAWDTRKAYFRRTWQRRPSSALHENTAARCAYKKTRRRMHGTHVPPDIEAKAPRFAKSAQDGAPAKTKANRPGYPAPTKPKATPPLRRQKPHPSPRALRMGHPPLQTAPHSYWALKVKSDVFDSLAPMVTV